MAAAAGRKTPRPVGLREICARTGLSTSTVSLALRGAYGVSEQTRRRVLETARQIGYDLRQLKATTPKRQTANSTAGATGATSATVPAELRIDVGRTGTRRQIAIVYSAASGLEAVTRAANYGRYLRGIQAAAQQLAVDLVFLPTHDGEDDPLLRFMFDSGPATPDGIILLGLGDEAPAVKRALTRPAPVVLLSRFVPELPCSWVSVDHVRAAALMTDHLVERGYRTIPLVSHELASSSWQRQRRQGYLESMARHGLTTDPLGGAIDTAREDLPTVAQRLSRLIAERPHETAIFVSVEWRALDLRRLLEERHFLAPRDYGLAGYDNIADEMLGAPAELTSIGFPRERMGALALRIARELCDDPTQEQQHVIVAPELHVRQSTEKP